MQTIGAHDKVEPACSCTGEGDIDPVVVLRECRDGVLKEIFDIVLCHLIEQFYQVVAPKLDITTGILFYEIRAQASHDLPCGIHKGDAFHALPRCPNLRQDAHAIGHVQGQTANVDWRPTCTGSR